MKVRILIFIVFLFYNQTYSQDAHIFKSIDFEQPEISLRNNKISFIWVYSENACSYQQEASLFQDSTLIQFYSENFSCYAVPYDSIKNKAFERLKISRSGYFFIDSSLNIIHKNLKTQIVSRNLIKLGKVVLDTNNRYDVIIKRFLEGERGFPFMLQYLRTRKNSKEITSKDIDTFVSMIDSSNYNRQEVREFIFDYFFCRAYDVGYYYFSTSDLPFKVLLYNRDLFIEDYDVKQIDLRINAILNFELKDLIKGQDLNLIKESAKYFNNTIPSFELKDTEGNIPLALKGNVNDTINKLHALLAFYYYEKGDSSNFFAHENQYLLIARNNSQGLFFLSNYYYRYSDSQQLSVRAEDLLREAYAIDSSDSSVVGLLAELLFKKKDYSEAMKYIEKSIVLYEINGISPSEYIQMKEKILNNSE